MTKNQLAVLRQKIRLLTGRRFSLERTAMGFVPMLAASLLERRFHKNAPAAYYLGAAEKVVYLLKSRRINEKI